tara:strand:- start:775 stop:1272 length:498 start_codon:yes stop_codon:yes gene_type:complete
MSDIDYYQKYLKYKTKYLDLKNDIDGGAKKKKQSPKEKFNEQVTKIEADVNSRFERKKNKFVKEVVLARKNIQYLNSIDCHSDFDKHGYSSVGSCQDYTKTYKDEKRERTNTKFLKDLNKENAKIQAIIKEVKNSTDDFENQLKKLTTANAEFKKKYPISMIFGA